MMKATPRGMSCVITHYYRDVHLFGCVNVRSERMRDVGEFEIERVC